MLLANVLINLHLKIQTFRVVDPIYALAPGSAVTLIVEKFMELLFSVINVLLRRVKDEIVVLSEDRDQAGFLGVSRPRQLFYEAEQFLLIDCVSFSETGDIDNTVECDAESLQLLQYHFAEGEPIVDLVQSRDVQDSETYVLLTDHMRNSSVKTDFLGDLVYAVGYGNGRVTRQQFRSG